VCGKAGEITGNRAITLLAGRPGKGGPIGYGEGPEGEEGSSKDQDPGFRERPRIKNQGEERGVLVLGDWGENEKENEKENDFFRSVKPLPQFGVARVCTGPSLQPWRSYEGTARKAGVGSWWQPDRPLRRGGGR